MLSNEYKLHDVPIANDSKNCKVIETSSKIDLENFCNNIKVVRILTDYNSIFAWDAQDLNHKEVSDYLFLKNHDSFWIENGILNWHFTTEKTKAEKFLSRWYPNRLDQLNKGDRKVKLF